MAGRLNTDVISDTRESRRSKYEKEKLQARAVIDIQVQSIEFKPHKDSLHGASGSTTDRASPEDRFHYMETVWTFFMMLSKNFASTWENARHGLRSRYGAGSVTLDWQEYELRVVMVYDPMKVMLLQCDQSSGELARVLQEDLVTEHMLSAMGIKDLQISTELSRT